MKNLNRLVLLVLTLLAGQFLVGQRIYVLDFNNRIGWISPEADSCEFHQLCKLVNPFGFGFSDISFHPNGKLYLIDSGGQLFETDTLACGINLIGKFSTGNFTSLTTDSDGKLFAAGNRLATFDPKNGQFSDLGLLPNFGQASGDLTFRNGQLYLVTIDNAILKVDGDDPEKSTIAFKPDNLAGADIYGIVTSAEGCLLQKTWATVSRMNQTEHFLYEIDFETESAILACSLPEGILGAATREEFQIANCDSTVVNPPGTPGFSIYIPNIFTPDDDGKNDFFTILADPTNEPTIRFLKIYDRWGGLVFEKTDFAANDLPLGWDGRQANSGKKVADGVYVFQAVIEFANGSSETRKGSITVARTE